jgi:hypothetical protein
MKIGLNLSPPSLGSCLHNQPLVWRGMGQGMRTAIQGLNGGTNISTTSRTRHYSNVPFNRFRLVFPIFQSTGTPIADVVLSGTFNFQFGIEYPFTNAVTGLAARTPITFSGVNYVTYNSATWDTSTGYIISDIITLPQSIPVGAFFGIWTTVELPAGVYNNALPWMINATNNLERNIGQSFSSSSRISGLGGASDFALASTSITHLGTTQAGVTGVFTPSMLLIETPISTKSVSVIGDSIGYGNNEGQTGSSTFGDSMGSSLGNAGYIDRGLYEVANLIGVNFSRGSDGGKYVTTATNWKYRRQLMILANPTHVINQNIHNDVSSSITISGWATNTAYVKYDVRSANAGIWMVEVGGTSLGSGTGPSGTGPTFSDNGITWRYIGTFPASANPRGYAQIFSYIASVNDQILAACPSVKIIQALCTPDATSSDSWATAGNQTVSTGWGDGTSRRGLINAMIRAKNARLNITEVVDPNQYLEDSYPTETSKWVSGSANFATQDGTHHNSKGANLAQAAVTAAKFS